MFTRPITVISILSLATLLTACGPTATGHRVRAEARERLNAYGASFTYAQAKQEFEAGQFARAIRNIDRAIQQTPGQVEFHVLRGRILLEQQQLEQSLAAFEEAIEVDETASLPHYYAGIVHQRWMQDESALEHYRKAFENERDNRQYLLACAETLINLEQLDEAQALVESKLSYFEFDPLLKQLLGQIAVLRGDAAHAARLYQEAQLLDPDNMRLREELMNIQFDAGMYADCLASLQPMRAAKPSRRDLQHQEARCLAALQRTSDAYVAYRALTNDTTATDPSLWVEFGAIAWEVGDYVRLSQCAARVITLAPDRYEGYLYRGVVAKEKGNVESAARHFSEAIRRAGDEALPALLLGRTFEESGRPDAALAAYRSALEMDPNSQVARELIVALETR